jgi:glycosyltransferase involved in cell wall biosynthesis
MSKRVLVVTGDRVGTHMAGPAIRAWHFAEELGRSSDVTLMIPDATDLSTDAFDVRVADLNDSRAMTSIGRAFDVVISQRLPVPTAHALAAAGTRLIFDLYAPILIENLAFDAMHGRSRVRELQYRLNRLEFEAALRTGDAFMCASERQRDLYIGSLITAGRIDHKTYGDDTSLRDVIDVVPFGIDRNPPEHARTVLRGVVPGIGEQDRIVLWGGGIWNWFDPLTVIRAVELLGRTRDDIRLFFLGTAHPNPRIEEMAMTGRAIALADELRVRDRSVIFNLGWVPYAEIGSYLLEADVGVAAYFDDIETRFAFRTRLVDYIWAGLPMVTTRGDTLSELVEENGLGRTVAPGDVEGFAAALEDLIKEGGREERAPAFAAVRDNLSWPRVAQPLVRLVNGETTAPSTGRMASLGRWAGTRLEYAVRRRGIGGAAQRAMNVATQRRPWLR